MKILLPQVGESVTEAVVERWLTRVGERVEKYDSLAEVITDKVSMEMPSPVAGVVRRLLVDEGQTVPMGAVIAEIDVDGDEPTAEDSVSPAGVETIASGPLDRTGTLLKNVAPVGPTGSGGPLNIESTEAPRRAASRISPAVARLAAEHSVDLSLVTGTGIAGRVTRKDVQAYVASGQDAAATPAPSPTVEDERIPLTPVRRMIAENMVRSATEIPEAWTTVEADVTSLVQLRERVKEDFRRREGVNITYLAFVLKAVAQALRANPLVNSSWDGDAIVLKHRINVGVATATPDGLLVPVLRDADTMDVPELARTVDDLAARARQGRLRVEEVQSGTFTVNNTGALGSVIGKAIIFPSQAAILNTEAIVKRPVVIDDAIAIRSIMNLSLTFDHRILDGAEAGAFLANVKRHLESLRPDTSL